MSSVKDKNLLFYSIHPNDEYSREFMKELEKNQILKKQFVLVCVNDPNIRIPDKIKQLGKVPVLIVAGFNRPIFGTDAVSWLKNNSFQGKANGMDYGSLNNDDSRYAFLGDELKPSDYNQFFNNDYNHGFVEKDGVLNQQFTNIKNDTHITTYSDANEMKKDIQGQLEQRLSQYRQQRDSDIPKPVKRIGGFEEQPTQPNQPNFYNIPNGGSGGGNSGNAGGAPTYNPNPFATNVQQQQPQMGRQLPFAMPNNAGGQYPTLPFNMGQGQGPSLPFQMGGGRMPPTRNRNL